MSYIFKKYSLYYYGKEKIIIYFLENKIKI